jgi:hypothetical protein
MVDAGNFHIPLGPCKKVVFNVRVLLDYSIYISSYPQIPEKNHPDLW